MSTTTTARPLPEEGIRAAPARTLRVCATDPRLYRVPAAAGGTLDAERGRAPDGAPPGPWTLTTAYRWCERMAATHYENFPVASTLLPAESRRHIAAIYAFARTADDFADEPRFEGRRQAALCAWEQMLEACYHREVRHPVFMALRDTVRRCDVPIDPLRALLTAFRMDLTRHEYTTFTQLLHYCRHSANPVGQLVLYVHDYRDPQLHRLGDEICSALQVTNFLQDLSVDIPRGRRYLPREDLIHFGVRDEDLSARIPTRELAELMRFSVARVRSMFHRGRPLIRHVGPRLSMELDATWRGGMMVLRRIEEQGVETIDRRPTLRRRQLATIAVRSLLSLGYRAAATAIRGRP